jgi:hypothetical protein
MKMALTTAAAELLVMHSNHRSALVMQDRHSSALPPSMRDSHQQPVL